MKDREAVLQALEGLLDQVQRLSMEQVVLRSALVTLAQHLPPQKLQAVANDLETMGLAQPDGGWQEGHRSLAGVLRQAHALRQGRGPR